MRTWREEQGKRAARRCAEGGGNAACCQQQRAYIARRRSLGRGVGVSSIIALALLTGFRDDARPCNEQLRGLVVALFMPIFFSLAGLHADLTILRDPTVFFLTIGLILIASIGKFAGAFLGGALGRMSVRESLALGCGMNARGSVQVIVASIGLSMGVLSQDLFTMIVAVAVITTMAMPPTLRWALSGLPLRSDEHVRLEREAFEATGFVTNIERLLVAADDSANGKLAWHLGDMLARARGIPMTVLHLGPRESVQDTKPPARSGEAAKRRKRRDRSQRDG